MIVHHKLRLLAVLSVILLAVLSSSYVAKQGIKAQLHHYLSQNLTAYVNDALQSSFRDEASREFIQIEINRYLESLKTQSFLQEFITCEVRLVKWVTNERINDNSPDKLLIKWHSGPASHQMQFTISCRVLWPQWLWWQIVLGSLLMFIVIKLPAALSKRQLDWLMLIKRQTDVDELKSMLGQITLLSQNQYQWLVDQLLQGAMTAQTLKSCLHDPRFILLDEVQIEWLACALNANELNAKAAIDVALSPSELVFDETDASLTIHGLPVTLSKTPYLYYLWYACRRKQGAEEGWLLNPATNKADLETGQSIATFMRNHQGHPRAINDLDNNGLTPKKLDQNRNLIKEEISAVLGDKLAEAFLFEAKRNLRTGRFAYRLAIEPLNIIVLEKNKSSHVKKH